MNKDKLLPTSSISMAKVCGDKTQAQNTCDSGVVRQNDCCSLQSCCLKNEEKKWMTPEEAAAYLRVPVGTLYNLISRGRLRRSGAVGNRARFLASDLDAFLSSELGEKK